MAKKCEVMMIASARSAEQWLAEVDEDYSSFMGLPTEEYSLHVRQR